MTDARESGVTGSGSSSRGSGGYATNLKSYQSHLCQFLPSRRIMSPSTGNFHDNRPSERTVPSKGESYDEVDEIAPIFEAFFRIKGDGGRGEGVVM